MPKAHNKYMSKLGRRRHRQDVERKAALGAAESLRLYQEAREAERQKLEREVAEAAAERRSAQRHTFEVARIEAALQRAERFTTDRRQIHKAAIYMELANRSRKPTIQLGH